ncbi:hypothetical protein J2754_000942 [Halarchaeum solikamskense]|uniref:DUF6789 family protein n=1 Tax=Halarchaeum nitratireducens TaxID=489913 RepID=UPI001B3AAAE0|nr:DUF6789 family protein [Halarchaeum solikamskense]MBP2250633.1 hypothetical protein [Halarchaeum solikamskense]
MRVTVLGTGSALPDGERAQSGLLVGDGGARVLVDCGSGVLERLARTETGPTGLDAVCLTHHHLDHVSDLLPLLKSRWLAAGDDGPAALPVVGPPGTTELIDDLLDVHAYLADRVRVEPRDVAGGIAGTAGLVSVLFAGDVLTGYRARPFESLGSFVGAQPDPAVGFLLFAAIGVFAWPLVYLSLRECLPGGVPGARGVVFAVPLWIGYAVVFGLGAGEGGSLVGFPLVTLVAHLVYGGLLGFVSVRLGDGNFDATV